MQLAFITQLLMWKRSILYDSTICNDYLLLMNFSLCAMLHEKNIDKENPDLPATNNEGKLAVCRVYI